MNICNGSLSRLRLYRYLTLERKTISPIDTSPMQKLARKLGKQWLGGLVVYRGDEIKRLADFGIWAVPSYRLFC